MYETKIQMICNIHFDFVFHNIQRLFCLSVCLISTTTKNTEILLVYFEFSEYSILWVNQMVFSQKKILHNCTHFLVSVFLSIEQRI